MQLKARYNQQGFDDLLLDLDKALQIDQTGSLSAAIGELYPCALIDEFQDTDAIQYRIFSKVYLARELSGCLFFIGDPKQAIYSFRGADIFTYMQARAEIDTRYTLATNWRSTPALIRAVNAVFADSEYKYSFLYDAIPFIPVKSGKALKDGFSIAGAAQKPLLFGKPIPTKPMPRAASWQKPVPLKFIVFYMPTTSLIDDKPVQAEDIAILVRSSTEAKVVQAALNARGIPSAYLSSSESVFAQPLAHDLYRLLTGILHAQDTKNCAQRLQHH